MKILFSAWRYHPNHDGMIAGLMRAGHEVAFLVFSTHPTESYFDGVKVHVVEQASPGIFLRSRTPRKGHRKFVPSRSFLYRYLKDNMPDLVIAREYNRTNYTIFVICQLLGIIYINYTQSRDGYEGVGGLRPFLLRLGLWPRHTLNTVIESPKRAIAGKTYDFIPFAVDTHGLCKKNYPGGAPVRIFTIGKLDSERKNNIPLVESLAPLLREGKVALTILGLRGETVTPQFQKLLDTIERERVGGAVTLLENLPYEESRRLFEQHDLFVMVSSRESAGISPVEAMATGLPVIVGSDTGTKYFVDHGESGFVFEDMNFPEFVRRVEYFLDNPGEIERMGQAARRKIVEEYSPEAFERRLMAMVARRFPELAARHAS